ncbi:zinc ribbon domain-containing protein [Olsenella profusa]|uniref:Zinc ribbon domain-containing protein n=1 Tax=Olsenella profusa TaxID=138595 RepID=A0ABS2F0I3_9ACTN|nr:zinc ribbon domain-containing protein [Olsenella profusa]MBM6774083.1 zinc ribbon domain-containing protein [Olsenella profusa]
MKCPTCGAVVPDGALTCPSCHAELDVTQRITLSEATWCPECGALVEPGADVCPKCGTSLAPDLPRRHTRDLDLPDIGNTGVMDALGDGSDATGVMTRIESAIPPADAEESRSAARDHMPRPRAFGLAALLAVVLVGGAALLITHPWNPSATMTRATEPADTSMSGFPGVVESLTGQDGSSAAQGESDDSPDGPADPLEALTQAHQSLADLSDRVDASEASLRDVGVSGTADERSAGLAAAQQNALDVSNLIERVGMLDDAGGTYAEARDNLLTLGNWLRNRCDALTESWQRSVDAEGPAASAQSILAPVDAATDYARLFEENIDAWDPSNNG